jgi:hypothetical protein
MLRRAGVAKRLLSSKKRNLFHKMVDMSTLSHEVENLEIGSDNEAGPSVKKAADKWVKPNGPPVGVTFGARRLKDEEDVFSQNAWCVHL